MPIEVLIGVIAKRRPDGRREAEESMKRTVAIVFATLWIALGAGAPAADVVYVQSAKAKILSSPAFGADVVATAGRGEALAVLEKESAWRKVRYQGKVGWVSNLIVGEKPPLAKITVLDQPGQELDPEARRRASATVTAGASRGLLAEGRSRASRSEASDRQALA
jgi:hypothetical protein